MYKTSESAPKYVVPPGLINRMYEFHAMIETAKGRPILIVGPTGVGKSLFIHMFEEWHKKNGRIQANRINCSNFGKDLARSELFGHEKGSFTGAVNKKIGLIESSDGGVLILEEMEKLTDDCQAQLLTVIEDKYFHKVGSNKAEYVKDLVILGTMNIDPNELREDFRNRFLIFGIPPLYMRRGDILYYLAFSNPEIFEHLYPWETLLLLAYNWPGNVREVNRVVSAIEARKHLRQINPLIKLLDKGDSDFEFLEEGTELSVGYIYLLIKKILIQAKNSEFDIDALDRILFYFGLSISPYNYTLLKGFDENAWNGQSAATGQKLPGRPFIFPLIYEYPTSDPDTLWEWREKQEEMKMQLDQKYQELFNVRILPEYQSFIYVLRGFRIFCSLFSQRYDSHTNCLISILKGHYEHFPNNFEDVPEEYQKDLKKLSRQCFEFCSGIRLPENVEVPLNYSERKNFFNVLLPSYPDNSFLCHVADGECHREEKSQESIFWMSEKEFEKFYYSNLLAIHGSVAKISEVLGIPRQTVYSRLRALKKDVLLNFEP